LPQCAIHRAAEQRGFEGAEPPTFKSGGLISKIAPPTFCVPKIFYRALFGVIGEITV